MKIRTRILPYLDKEPIMVRNPGHEKSEGLESPDWPQSRDSRFVYFCH